MLIDFHTHAFPDGLAKSAVPMMEKMSGLTAYSDGTLSDLNSKMEGWGVDRHVILNIATKPGQHKKVNAFAKSCLSSSVSCFGSVHPLDGDIKEALSGFKAEGFSGLKLHPDYQLFFADSPEAFKVYEICEGIGLIVCLHAGFDPKSPDLTHATPKMIAKAAKAFPGLTFIAAHLGGMFRFDEVEEHIAGLRNVYIDISMMAGHIQGEQYKRVILSHGADRVLFGSDCPWSNPAKEMGALTELGLDKSSMDLILYKNALRLLGGQKPNE